MISLFAVLAAPVYHKIPIYAILTQHEGFIQFRNGATNLVLKYAPCAGKREHPDQRFLRSIRIMVARQERRPGETA
jgi:hypothetical protein